MDELIAFLTERLAEDEAAASEVHLPRQCGSVDRDGEFSADPVYCTCGGPARVLREVAAKRARLERYQRAAAGGLPEWRAGRELIEAAAAILLGAPRDDAAVWSGHPHYRKEWAPVSTC